MACVVLGAQRCALAHILTCLIRSSWSALLILHTNWYADWCQRHFGHFPPPQAEAPRSTRCDFPRHTTP